MLKSMALVGFRTRLSCKSTYVQSYMFTTAVSSKFAEKKLYPAKMSVLGCGAMGSAFISGVISAGHVNAKDIIVTSRSDHKLVALRELGVQVTRDNVAAVDKTLDCVIISVKPDMCLTMCDSIKNVLGKKTLVSLCAGITLKQIGETLTNSIIVRAMPNTPAIIRQGMTVISANADVDSEQIAYINDLFKCVGRVLQLPEHMLNACTGLSGSGPAYAAVVIESLADGGVMAGLPRKAALELAAQTVAGTANMLLERGIHPAQLKDEVTTPAGCTIAGLLIMEDGRIRSTLARAIQESSRIASELGQKKK